MWFEEIQYKINVLSIFLISTLLPDCYNQVREIHSVQTWDSLIKAVLAMPQEKISAKGQNRSMSSNTFLTLMLYLKIYLIYIRDRYEHGKVVNQSSVESGDISLLYPPYDVML